MSFAQTPLIILCDTEIVLKKNIVQIDPNLDSTKTKNDQKILNENIIKNNIFTAFSQIIFMIQSGRSINRHFNSEVFQYNQQILNSRTTYWGIVENLINLSSCFDKYDLVKICVLCPRYCDTFCEKNSKYFPSDTQGCVGSKITKVWDCEKQEYIDQSFTDCAREQLRLKLRICNACNPFCMSKSKIRVCSSNSKNSQCGKLFGDKKQTKYMYHTYTQIYSIKASECYNINDYDICESIEGVNINMNKKNLHKKDISTSKVGCIVWGTFSECMRLVESIPVDKSKISYFNNIDGVSIVSLNKALEMAQYASKFLNGAIVEHEFF